MRACLCGGLTPDAEGREVCLHCDRPLGPAASAGKWLALAGAVLLAACYGPPGGYRRGMYGRVDADGDGAYAPLPCTGGACPAPSPDDDCDDHDPTRYPGAADPDGDGIDQNCDGVDGWADPAQAVAPSVGATSGSGSGSGSNDVR